jgi:hypothetical protein
MVIQANASGTFLEGHSYIWHIYLIIAFGCRIFQSWKNAKIITLPKTGKDPKFPKKIGLIRLLSTTSIFIETVILKMAQIHIEVRDVLDASQFGFCAQHSTTLQCMRLKDHVTLIFNNNMSAAVVPLDYEKAFDTTCHPGLLYKLYKINFWQI